MSTLSQQYSSEDDIYEKVRDIFADSFGMDRDSISLETRLYDDLDLDSLDAIDLSAKLAAETDLRILEQELMSIRTVGDIVNVVHQKLMESK